MSSSSSVEKRVPDKTDGLDARSVADYIESMSAELGVMAERSQFRLLHYLLDMVRLEAKALTKDAVTTTGDDQ